jgi:hypothetical protein
MTEFTGGIENFLSALDTLRQGIVLGENEPAGTCHQEYNNQRLFNHIIEN